MKFIYLLCLSLITLFLPKVYSQCIEYPVYDAGFDMVPGRVNVLAGGQTLTEYEDWIGYYSHNQVKIINPAIVLLSTQIIIQAKQNPGVFIVPDTLSSFDLIQQSHDWKLSGIPLGQTDFFPEASFAASQISGFNRAKLSWYIIDPVFYERTGNNKPVNITDEELNKPEVRMILKTEMFPNMDIAEGQNCLYHAFNLAFFPNERGPYNYDVDTTAFSAGIRADGHLEEPETRWAGIMRDVDYHNWSGMEVKYIDMLFMDPYEMNFYEDTLTDDPELLIQLGRFSEDINKDNGQFYEQAVHPGFSGKQSPFGIIPEEKPAGFVFTDVENQDYGLDGIGDEREKSYFSDFLLNIGAKFGFESEAYKNASMDPSSDNYHPYYGADCDEDNKYASILERYKNYTNSESNTYYISPVSNNNFHNYSNFPETEDLNKDLVFDTLEQYYQYNVKLSQKEIYTTNPNAERILRYYKTYGYGGWLQMDSTKWIRIRIPIDAPNKIVGDISGLNDVQQIRLVTRGCGQELVLRFAWLHASRVEKALLFFDEDDFMQAIDERNDWDMSLIYPNPNNGNCILNVCSDDTRRIEIFDVNGSLVFARDFEDKVEPNILCSISQKSVHLPGLRKGIYIVRVLNNGQRNPIQIGKMLVVE
jgi:motility/secretion related protein SprA/type IX secretion system substrate protein